MTITTLPLGAVGRAGVRLKGKRLRWFTCKLPGPWLCTSAFLGQVCTGRAFPRGTGAGLLESEVREQD